ncbi:MAG: hypothetical protein IPK65_10930 [Gammaproteobacteria bacterium]|nr:hypothetical protein [Gammaproteobacteria bacterium]
MTPDCGCPSAYPPWHEQDVDLGGYRTHTLPIPTLVHMPLAYEIYLQRQQRSIEQLHLRELWPGLVLTRTGLLRGSITRLLEDVPSLSRHVGYLPRPFQVRAYLHCGNVSTIRQSVRDMQAQLLDAGCMPKELYLCYLTCPRCATQRGGDQILLLRHWLKSDLLGKRRSARPDRG